MATFSGLSCAARWRAHPHAPGHTLAFLGTTRASGHHAGLLVQEQMAEWLSPFWAAKHKGAQRSSSTRWVLALLQEWGAQRPSQGPGQR